MSSTEPCSSSQLPTVTVPCRPSPPGVETVLTAEVREGLEGTYGSLAAFSGRAHAELREVVCPFKTTFGKQKRGMRNERVVSYWAQWQGGGSLQGVGKARGGGGEGG